MDAINVVFNVFVAAVLVVGAFGITGNYEAPEPQATVAEGFSKKLSHPPTAETDVDACELPQCADGSSALKPNFVQTKKVIVAPAPAIVAVAPSPPSAPMAPTVQPVPATIKHGDDHPSTHSERGHAKAKKGADAEKKANDEGRKALEKAYEQARKAAEEQRKQQRKDRDDDRQERDERDEEDRDDD